MPIYRRDGVSSACPPLEGFSASGGLSGTVKAIYRVDLSNAFNTSVIGLSSSLLPANLIGPGLL